MNKNYQKMKMYKVFLKLSLFLGVFGGGSVAAFAQNGDQILDGIGETDMVARYVLNGDTKDWSRNSWHVTNGASELKFVNDPRFRRVLSLTGGKEEYLSIPAEALSGLGAISISGWLNLKSAQTGQAFFDFGRDINHRFLAAPTGTTAQEGFQAVFATGSNPVKAVSPAIVQNKWVHVVVVIDLRTKSLMTYVDNKKVSEVKNASLDLDALFVKDAEKNKLYVGKSLTSGSPNLNALVADFRIYNVPLTEKQIDGIFNSTRNRNTGVNEGKKEASLPQFAAEDSKLYNAYLVSVSDVQVETQVGELPRLPSFLQGVYEKGISGPKVRVIWPAPTDNSSVLKAGKYTITGKVPGTDLTPKAVITVKAAGVASTPEMKLEMFNLSQITLEADANNDETKFIENRDKFINTLAKTDPNSFLYMFRHAYGLNQPEGAKPLGVWDSEDTKLRGHATGHYLTAIAQAYSSSEHNKALQAQFAEKMDVMVNSLFEMSQMSGRPKQAGGASVTDPTKVPVGPGKETYDSDLSTAGIRNDYWNWGTGYISAYPPDQFIMLEKGAKYGGQKTQVWAPYYTLHKILAGLMDIYDVSGNQKALDVAKGMGDWVHARLEAVPQDTLIKMWNTYIAGEYGGMNESMARLNYITKDAKYMKTAQLFDNIKMFFGDKEHSHGLAKNVDSFRGLHANQHIPQVVGSIEMYRVANDPNYYKVADNFWYKAVNDYMYSIGGVAGARNPANAECFPIEPATLYENGLSVGGQNETCATYNMLKLTSSLFLFDQRAELMDYYERGLYNHILSSVAKDSPANTYHVPLNPGAIKQFGNPHMTGFTCCNGTAIESNTKLQNSIYFKSKDNSALYVNLYIPSVLHWHERDVTIEQVTNFPKEDHTKLTVKGNGKFDVNVRVPAWATKGFVVKINGKVQKVNATPGSYLKLSRNWKNGDSIELKMPFQFHLDPVMDQQNVASLFYGPILLAAQETEASKEWRKVTLDAKDLSKSIKGDPKKLEFTIGDVTFKPFYETYGRHSVYLDVKLK